MAEYKLYVLGPTGMIARGIWLDCDSDDEAIAAAQERACGEARELWMGARLIQTFDVKRRRRAAKAA
jgi:hypothetical protein